MIGAHRSGQQVGGGVGVPVRHAAHAAQGGEIVKDMDDFGALVPVAGQFVLIPLRGSGPFGPPTSRSCGWTRSGWSLNPLTRIRSFRTANASCAAWLCISPHRLNPLTRIRSFRTLHAHVTAQRRRRGGVLIPLRGSGPFGRRKAGSVLPAGYLSLNPLTRIRSFRTIACATPSRTH